MAATRVVDLEAKIAMLEAACAGEEADIQAAQQQWGTPLRLDRMGDLN